MKYTPGPWKSFGDNIVTDYGEKANVRYIGEAANESDARLMSAAPELYEQLRGLLDRHWDYMRDFEDLTPAYDAIAKAEGNGTA